MFHRGNTTITENDESDSKLSQKSFSGLQRQQKAQVI